MFKNSFESDRRIFNCESNFLEDSIPAFYLSTNKFLFIFFILYFLFLKNFLIRWDPADFSDDFFTNDWRDVKFLFHQEGNILHKWDFWRVREYNFRVLNYYVSLGMDGFRYFFFFIYFY